MLGHPKHHYHLEFTSHSTEKARHAPTQENLLVYYVPDGEEFESAIQRIPTSGFIKVQSFNPYWVTVSQSTSSLDQHSTVEVVRCQDRAG
jgi:hypothetical protein